MRILRPPINAVDGATVSVLDSGFRRNDGGVLWRLP
jgi:hypothetical protein